MTPRSLVSRQVILPSCRDDAVTKRYLSEVEELGEAVSQAYQRYHREARPYYGCRMRYEAVRCGDVE